MSKTYYSEDAIQELTKVSREVRKELGRQAIELIGKKHRDTVTQKDIQEIKKQVLEKLLR